VESTGLHTIYCWNLFFSRALRSV